MIAVTGSSKINLLHGEQSHLLNSYGEEEMVVSVSSKKNVKLFSEI